MSGEKTLLEDALLWPVNSFTQKDRLMAGLVGFGVMGWYLGFQFSGQNPLTMAMGYVYGGLAWAGYVYIKAPETV